MKDVLIQDRCKQCGGTIFKCVQCNRTHQFFTTPRNSFLTVDIIIRVGDSIVLIERKNAPKGWALPGGFVDYGESLESAAIREAKKETGLDIVNLKQFHAYSDPLRDPHQHNISIVFIAESKGQLKAEDSAKKAILVPKHIAPGLSLVFDHKQIINDYFDSISPLNVLDEAYNLGVYEGVDNG